MATMLATTKRIRVRYGSVVMIDKLSRKYSEDTTLSKMLRL